MRPATKYASAAAEGAATTTGRGAPSPRAGCSTLAYWQVFCAMAAFDTERMGGTLR